MVFEEQPCWLVEGVFPDRKTRKERGGRADSLFLGLQFIGMIESSPRRRLQGDAKTFVSGGSWTRTKDSEHEKKGNWCSERLEEGVQGR